MYAIRSYYDPGLDHLGQRLARHGARRSLADAGDLDHLVRVGQLAQGDAVADLDVLGVSYNFV